MCLYTTHPNYLPVSRTPILQVAKAICYLELPIQCGVVVVCVSLGRRRRRRCVQSSTNTPAGSTRAGGMLISSPRAPSFTATRARRRWRLARRHATRSTRKQRATGRFPRRTRRSVPFWTSCSTRGTVPWAIRSLVKQKMDNVVESLLAVLVAVRGHDSRNADLINKVRHGGWFRRRAQRYGFLV